MERNHTYQPPDLGKNFGLVQVEKYGFTLEPRRLHFRTTHAIMVKRSYHTIVAGKLGAI